MEIIDSFSSFFQGKKVLITGATGFKGSWMAIWLKELGADVYGFSLPPVSSKDNFVLAGLKNKINHQIGDIRDIQGLVGYFSEIQPEVAFHLAAQPLVIESYKDPVYTFQTNILGTVNFFEAVRKTPSVIAAINITSDKCYQNKEWIWGYRENDPMGGKDPYSASKGCSELISTSYIHSFFSDKDSPSIATARAGNVIGGGDWAEDRIIPDFFRAIENDGVLNLRYPNATRPWQHVLEPIGGYLLLASVMSCDKEKYRGAWNFGPKQNSSKSVLDLITELKVYSPDVKVNISENVKHHESHFLGLDISKASKLLGWKPRLDFKSTIRMTYAGYRVNSDDLYSSRVSQIYEFINIPDSD